jgi:hypothetical protein
MVTNPAAFRGYYEPYIGQVWVKFPNQSLSVNTQSRFGTLHGRVANNVFKIGS